MKPELPAHLLDEIVKRALDEDLASGDVTTEACVDETVNATARAVARKSLVVCGGPVLVRVFLAIDRDVRVTVDAEEGMRAEARTTLWTISGRARSILMGERVALNFVQRMSGTATLARTFVDAVPAGHRGPHHRHAQDDARIARSRALRRARRRRAKPPRQSRVGGPHQGQSHRSLRRHSRGRSHGRARMRLTRPKSSARSTRSRSSTRRSRAGADIVLLDNMDTETVKEAVRRAKGKALTEASGGVTLARVPELARAGVDAISVGALTHSAPAADIGLDFE
jgi:nicotinate-nucleotide pyrophosphorylase (carboxylating)